MDRIEFLKRMLDKGKITQAQHDATVAKVQTRADVVAKYKIKKSALTKAEMQEIIEKLI